MSTERARQATRGTALSRVEDVDPAVLIRFWTQQRLSWIAGNRYLEYFPDTPLVAAEIDRVRQELGIRSSVQALTTRRVQAALADAGVESVVLKGPVLAGRVHGDDRARGFSSDIDVLVTAECLWAAADALVRSGWNPPEDALDLSGLPLLHLSLDRNSPGHDVELHWRPHWLGGGEQQGRAVISRSETVGGLRVPDLADHLLILIAAHARDGYSGLRIPADISATWDQLERSHGADAQRILRGRLDSTPGLLDSLVVPLMVAERLTGAPFTAAAHPVVSRRRGRRIGGWILTTPLTPPLEAVKRACVDAIASPETVRERWRQPWHPRRARVAKLAELFGRWGRRWIVRRS